MFEMVRELMNYNTVDINKLLDLTLLSLEQSTEPPEK